MPESSFNGRIDTYNSSYFKKSVDKLISSGFPHLVFCCASLGYVSSTGIGVFLKIREAIKAQDGEMFMVDLQPQVYEVFEISRIYQFFLSAKPPKRRSSISGNTPNGPFRHWDDSRLFPLS